MLRIIFLFTGMIITIGSYSQSKIDLCFNFSPNYSYRQYSVSDYSNESNAFNASGKIIYDIYKKLYDSLESPRFGYGFTFGIGYNYNRRWKINTGLTYKNIGDKLTYRDIVGNYQVGGAVFNIYADEKTFNSSFQYIGIPVKLQFNPFIYEKVIIGFILGSDLDILLSSDLDNNLGIGTQGNRYFLVNTSRVCINLSCALQLRYKVHKSLELTVSPEFTRYITPNVRYEIQLMDNFYSKLNKYFYFGQINFGITYAI